MKTNYLTIPVITLSLISLVSCSHKLIGTWNVDKYETVTPGQQAVSLSNIGTMTFKSNNSGEKNLSYKVLGIEKKDDLPFDWSATENYVNIKNGGKELSKTWIILENKKNSQRWKSTNGSNQVQILQLSK